MNSKRTKIVCTIGPASRSVELIKSLVVSGMDLARISFSHDTHVEHAETIKNIKTAEALLGIRIPILQDLSGPKYGLVRLSQARLNSSRVLDLL